MKDIQCSVSCPPGKLLDLCYITDDMDPNVAFKAVNKIFLNIYETSFPLNTVCITRKSQKKS